MAHGVTNISGARKEGIYGKTTGATINLKDSKGNDVKPKQGEFVYMNETIQLLRDNPVIQEYDRTTPTQVVNQAYSTSGNGGRKLVRLDNGWLVALALDSSTLRIYVSKDSGVTFNPLSTIVGTVVAGNYSIVPVSGSIVCIVRTLNTTDVRYHRIDVDLDLSLGTFVVDSGQSSFGSGLSLAIDSNGHLHAAWASKNSTYPSSFNIRYSKSTDGGVTWESPTQVTTENTAGRNRISPTIVVTNNLPKIIYQWYATSNFGIFTSVFNGTTWSETTKPQSSIANYPQSTPSATVDSNGVINVAWNGKDATDTSYNNIRYSKSNDNGVSWSAVEKLTSGNTVDRKSPSISTDLLNNIYIAYEDNGTTKYLKNEGYWNAPVTISTGTDVSVCDNYKNFKNPITLFDGGADVKFYGKWAEGEITQVIPSVNDATSESELQTIDSGTLKSHGNTQKHYVGFKTNKAIGFTPF